MTDREQAEEHFRIAENHSFSKGGDKIALKEYRQALALCPEMAGE